MQAIIFALLVFVFLPYSLWKNSSDLDNIKKHGKKLPADIIEVSGINDVNVRYKYHFKGKRFEKVIDYSAEPKRRVGDIFYVVIDTLDPDNNMPLLWDE